MTSSLTKFVKIVPIHALEEFKEGVGGADRIREAGLDGIAHRMIFPFQNWYQGTLEIDQSVVNPDTQVCVSFTAGSGATEHGMVSGRNYFWVDETIWERINYTDLGMKRQTGLKFYKSKKLIYWVRIADIKPSGIVEVNNQISKKLRAE